MYLLQPLLLFLILLFFHQFREILLDAIGPRDRVLSVVVSGEMRDQLIVPLGSGAIVGFLDVLVDDGSDWDEKEEEREG